LLFKGDGRFFYLEEEEVVVEEEEEEEEENKVGARVVNKPSKYC